MSKPWTQVQVQGQGRDLTVTLISQTCTYDPFGSCEDVWEEARDRIFDQGEFD